MRFKYNILVLVLLMFILPIFNVSEAIGIKQVENTIEEMVVHVLVDESIELIDINLQEKEIDFTIEIPDKSWVIINKSNNNLYHLEGNKIIKRYPVATGKTAEHTPEGKFTIVTKYINPAWGGAGKFTPVRGGASNNPLGKRWMGLSIRGGGTFGIHGNSDSQSIGKYVTLGCVRMFNEDVEVLYELIDYGTSVWIGSEKQLKEYGVLFTSIDLSM